MWAVIAIILVLGIVCIAQFRTNQNLRHEYAVAETNIKSLLNDKDKEIIELQFSMDVLRNTTDSTIQNLLKQKDKLSIKNKELQTMISLASQFHVQDTILICDTIFKAPDFILDTCVNDDWRSTCINLKYPNQIYVDATMRSQKDVFVTAKRETINPPKKCFFLRWFQKKHTVTRITINEENPYITSQENIYIRVLDE